MPSSTRARSHAALHLLSFASATLSSYDGTEIDKLPNSPFLIPAQLPSIGHALDGFSKVRCSRDCLLAACTLCVHPLASQPGPVTMCVNE